MAAGLPLLRLLHSSTSGISTIRSSGGTTTCSGSIDGGPAARAVQPPALWRSNSRDLQYSSLPTAEPTAATTAAATTAAATTAAATTAAATAAANARASGGDECAAGGKALTAEPGWTIRGFALRSRSACISGTALQPAAGIPAEKNWWLGVADAFPVLENRALRTTNACRKKYGFCNSCGSQPLGLLQQQQQEAFQRKPTAVRVRAEQRQTLLLQQQACQSQQHLPWQVQQKVSFSRHQPRTYATAAAAAEKPVGSLLSRRSTSAEPNLTRSFIYSASAACMPRFSAAAVSATSDPPGTAFSPAASSAAASAAAAGSACSVSRTAVRRVLEAAAVLQRMKLSHAAQCSINFAFSVDRKCVSCPLQQRHEAVLLLKRSFFAFSGHHNSTTRQQQRQQQHQCGLARLCSCTCAAVRAAPLSPSLAQAHRAARAAAAEPLRISCLQASDCRQRPLKPSSACGSCDALLQRVAAIHTAAAAAETGASTVGTAATERDVATVGGLLLETRRTGRRATECLKTVLGSQEAEASTVTDGAAAAATARETEAPAREETSPEQKYALAGWWQLPAVQRLLGLPQAELRDERCGSAAALCDSSSNSASSSSSRGSNRKSINQSNPASTSSSRTSSRMSNSGSAKAAAYWALAKGRLSVWVGLSAVIGYCGGVHALAAHPHTQSLLDSGIGEAAAAVAVAVGAASSSAAAVFSYLSAAAAAAVNAIGPANAVASGLFSTYCSPVLPAAASASAALSPSISLASSTVAALSSSPVWCGVLPLLLTRSSAVGLLLQAGSVAAAAAVLFAGVFAASAAANALNQLYEKRLDSLMKRTSHRPVARGFISPLACTRFAAGAAAAGVSLLLHFPGAAAALAASNIVLYAGVYTPLKTFTPFSTHIGALVGAIPLLIGWTAAGGSMWSSQAVLLGGLQYLWQFPHFYTLCWLHRHDYKKAGYVMFGVNDDNRALLTKKLCKRYLAALIAAPTVSAAFGVTSWMYTVSSLPANIFILYSFLRFYRSPSRSYGRHFFFHSLWHIILLLLLAVYHLKPVPLSLPEAEAATATAGADDDDNDHTAAACRDAAAAAARDAAVAEEGLGLGRNISATTAEEQKEGGLKESCLSSSVLPSSRGDGSRETLLMKQRATSTAETERGSPFETENALPLLRKDCATSAAAAVASPPLTDKVSQFFDNSLHVLKQQRRVDDGNSQQQRQKEEEEAIEQQQQQQQQNNGQRSSTLRGQEAATVVQEQALLLGRAPMLRGEEVPDQQMISEEQALLLLQQQDLTPETSLASQYHEEDTEAAAALLEEKKKQQQRRMMSSSHPLCLDAENKGKLLLPRSSSSSKEDKEVAAEELLVDSASLPKNLQFSSSSCCSSVSFDSESMQRAAAAAAAAAAASRGRAALAADPRVSSDAHSSNSSSSNSNSSSSSNSSSNSSSSNSSRKQTRGFPSEISTPYGRWRSLLSRLCPHQQLLGMQNLCPLSRASAVFFWKGCQQPASPTTTTTSTQVAASAEWKQQRQQQYQQQQPPCVGELLHEQQQEELTNDQQQQQLSMKEQQQQQEQQRYHVAEQQRLEGRSHQQKPHANSEHRRRS